MGDVYNTRLEMIARDVPDGDFRLKILDCGLRRGAGHRAQGAGRFRSIAFGVIRSLRFAVICCNR